MTRPEDDIVVRLRAATQVYENQWHEECREGAEEIMRLRNLLRRTVGFVPEDRYSGHYLQWQGGGYDCESIEPSAEEVAVMERVYAHPWCRDCERILEPGESMWTVYNSVYCDEHWAEYKERQESYGRTVVEEAE